MTTVLNVISRKRIVQKGTAKKHEDVVSHEEDADHSGVVDEEEMCRVGADPDATGVRMRHDVEGEGHRGR